jgi:hypothetical protein
LVIILDSARESTTIIAVAAEKPPRNTTTEMRWLSKCSGSRRMKPSASAPASGNTRSPAKAMGSTNRLMRNR